VFGGSSRGLGLKLNTVPWCGSEKPHFLREKVDGHIHTPSVNTDSDWAFVSCTPPLSVASYSARTTFSPS
jgi:hypothetical protein